jgi:putative iron-regulated protein
MHRGSIRTAAFVVAWMSCPEVSVLPAQAPAQQREAVASRDVVAGYAETCRRLYAACAERASGLDEAVRAFCETPTEERLVVAREAWVVARVAYCRTECLRFYGGPIDDVEPLVNAWPIDEAYIDSVEGREACGIIHDVEQFPRVHETVLTLVNERGGEANVSVGWHAVEFLIWGQDRDASGPGRRSAKDFVDGAAPFADRRRQYLRATTALLAKQMRELEHSWTAGKGDWRERFESEPHAMRKALTGALVFTAFELGGERLAVAYETQDQEQEHSCFSDTSCSDLVQGQAGLIAVLTGNLDGEPCAPGLLAAVPAKDAELVALVRRRLEETNAALRAIPHPFDQAILGSDDSAGRVALRLAIEALERQAEALTFLGHSFGYELPVRPGN